MSQPSLPASALDAPRSEAAPDGSPRREALKTLGVGALMVTVSLGVIVAAAVFGWHSVMVSGIALLLGWTYLGFGLGEFLFAGRFRVVAMLLALLLGVGGMTFSFAVIRLLGFTLR